jgi:hypothetical protein
MNKEIITKLLESIITIDGKGRPAKARLLISLLCEVNTVNLIDSIKDIGERKF